MGQPDEALLWARDQAVTWWERAPGVREKDKAAHIENIRAGKSDDDLEGAVRDRLSWLEGYRAGADDREKELEARVAELERQVNTLRRVVGTDKIVPLQAYYKPTDEPGAR